MMYINSYLDKIGELIHNAMRVANDIEKVVKELIDEENIKEMFRSDVELIMDKFHDGEVTNEEALNNLKMLKLYVISQLNVHLKRIVEVLDDLEKKIRRLKEEASKQEVMADLVEDIVNTIKKAEMKLKH